MDNLKRKYTEVIAQYKFEDSLRDIYVEGNCDKVFFEYYIENKKCNRKVQLIENVDFSQLDNNFLKELDRKSNKNKLIILSELLTKEVKKTHVKCIVDKDFDDFIKCINNNIILRTDFSCLESYLFNDQVINKFLTIGIRNFPLSTSFVMAQLSEILKKLFCLRLFKEINYKSASLVNYDGNIKINKKTNELIFDINDYLEKFIHKNNLYHDRDKIFDSYFKLLEKLNKDIRNYIHGHDFLEIFYIYISKVKQTRKISAENISNVLFLTVETIKLESYNLFKSIA